LLPDLPAGWLLSDCDWVLLHWFLGPPCVCSDLWLRTLHTDICRPTGILLFFLRWWFPVLNCWWWYVIIVTWFPFLLLPNLWWYLLTLFQYGGIRCYIYLFFVVDGVRAVGERYGIHSVVFRYFVTVLNTTSRWLLLYSFVGAILVGIYYRDLLVFPCADTFPLITTRFDLLPLLMSSVSHSQYYVAFLFDQLWLLLWAIPDDCADSLPLLFWYSADGDAVRSVGGIPSWIPTMENSGGIILRWCRYWEKHSIDIWCSRVCGGIVDITVVIIWTIYCRCCLILFCQFTLVVWWPFGRCTFVVVVVIEYIDFTIDLPLLFPILGMILRSVRRFYRPWWVCVVCLWPHHVLLVHCSTLSSELLVHALLIFFVGDLCLRVLRTTTLPSLPTLPFGSADCVTGIFRCRSAVVLPISGYFHYLLIVLALLCVTIPREWCTTLPILHSVTVNLTPRLFCCWSIYLPFFIYSVVVGVIWFFIQWGDGWLFLRCCCLLFDLVTDWLLFFHSVFPIPYQCSFYCDIAICWRWVLLLLLVLNDTFTGRYLWFWPLLRFELRRLICWLLCDYDHDLVDIVDAICYSVIFVCIRLRLMIFDCGDYLYDPRLMEILLLLCVFIPLLVFHMPAFGTFLLFVTNWYWWLQIHITYRGFHWWPTIVRYTNYYKLPLVVVLRWHCGGFEGIHWQRLPLPCCSENDRVLLGLRHCTICCGMEFPLQYYDVTHCCYWRCLHCTVFHYLTLTIYIMPLHWPYIIGVDLLVIPFSLWLSIVVRCSSLIVVVERFPTLLWVFGDWSILDGVTLMESTIPDTFVTLLNCR